MLTLAHVDDEDEVQEDPEHDVELLKPREDAAKALQSAKQPLHFVAPLVEIAVVFPRLLAVRFGRDDGLEAQIQNKLSRLFAPLTRGPSASAGRRAVFSNPEARPALPAHHVPARRKG